MSIQKIVIKGTEIPAGTVPQTDTDALELKRSYNIGATVRGFAETHEIALDQNDFVELVFNDETIWYCNSDSIDEVFPQGPRVNRSGEAVFEIPSTLDGNETERSIGGSILLKGLNIFGKKAITKKVHEIAEDFEKKQLEHLSGLYRLDDNFQLQPFTNGQPDQHFLLFLHGTASSTKGSFGELLNSDLWKLLGQTYQKNILAFQHETLTKSPLLNVLELVQKLPQNSTIDLISHSRGGLVGDTLARFCNSNGQEKGFDENEIAYLEKAENRKDDLEKIEEIRKALENKKIKVNRFIRVACPAQGTTLASKRMDHFFNVTFNLLGLAGGIAAAPAYAAFKNLIAAVMDCKNEVDVLPGLEAMNPDSPFIKVLNSPNSTIVLDQPLTVISGNCKTKFNLKALLIIVSKLFYLKDNDLVVNTLSMYYGSQRQTPTQYLFDEATDVDHFHYFKNKKTTDALMMAVKTPAGDQIPGFNIYQKNITPAGERNALLGLDGGKVFTDTVTGNKPIVVLLPGIMGSNLSNPQHAIWINYLRFVSGGLLKLDVKNKDISAPSLISTSYKKLVKFLEADYDVVTFPFDWRLQLNECAKIFNEKIKTLLSFHQPIKIIGHSMGGVLVRDFIINHPDTWKHLNSSPDFKLVFLGAPLGGSFRIPFVLMGKDPIIDKLSKIDIFHTKKELLSMFSKMPGLLSLLPLTNDNGNNFAETSTWQNLSSPLGKWPLPAATDLKEFGQYRDNILSSMDALEFSNAVYIAGRDSSTPCGYRVEDTSRGKELVFLSTAEGDQSVTWESGIPKKMIESNAVYYSNTSHGDLANDPSLFPAIAEILSTGATSSVSKTRPQVRSADKIFRTPEQADFDISAEGVTNTLLGLKGTQTETSMQQPIRVTISNGDLKYATYPLLVGHFLHDGILNAEKEVDRNLSHALSEMHKLSIYPGPVGSCEVFLNDKTDFKGAIIIGLGESGNLTAFQLTQTIEQAVCKYLLLLARQDANTRKVKSAGPIGLSTLLIGSGYGGLSIENSIRAILQGIQNANKKIQDLNASNPLGIQFLEIIELFEDAALAAFYSVSRLESEEHSSLHFVKDSQKMRMLFGSKKRIPFQSGDNWWNRITVQLDTKDAVSGSRSLLYNASTGGAREQQRRIRSNPAFIDKLVDEMSTNNMWSKELASAIFELLIPNDFKENLSRQCNINWILDKDTAGYPWELLQDKSADALPLSVNAGMVRQLATADDRTDIRAVFKNNALVIGDPFLDGFVTQLPGALEEAKHVAAVCSENSFSVTSSFGGVAPEIIKLLFSNDYKIIHLAGHGLFNPDDPMGSGMVIGKKIFLTTSEIAQMSITPELVFVNCCFLGKTDGVSEELYRGRYKLAANIGTQLIENGVKVVVVAGWAVDDAAALEFTKIFYQNMFQGASFGDAVHRARKSIYEQSHTSNNTWGAYQCYGDPFYKFDPRISQSRKYDPKFVIPLEAEIALSNLHNEMETGEFNEGEILARLISISQAVDNVELRNATITASEAHIYADLYMYDAAISKFQQVMDMEKADFAVSALEKYGEVRSKQFIKDYLKGTPRNKLITEMKSLIKNIDMLLDISHTAERFSLLGSAYKRLSYVSLQSKKHEAHAASAYHYRLAHDFPKNTNKAYALTNWLEMESLLVHSGIRSWGTKVSYGKSEYDLLSKKMALDALKELQTPPEKTGADMNYWDMLRHVNLTLSLLIMEADYGNDKKWNDLLMAYKRIWSMAGTKGNKLAEIEHLDILIDGLSASKKRDATGLRKKITTLKEELEKML